MATPAIYTPITKAQMGWFSNQGKPCGDLEMDFYRCASRVGQRRSMVDCEKEFADFQECMFRRKQVCVCYFNSHSHRVTNVNYSEWSTLLSQYLPPSFSLPLCLTQYMCACVHYFVSLPQQYSCKNGKYNVCWCFCLPPPEKWKMYWPHEINCLHTCFSWCLVIMLSNKI